MPYQPDLNLKTAISLIDEVTAQIEPFKKTISQMSQASPDQGEDSFLLAISKGLWQGFKDGLQIKKESANLLQKCEQATALASSVKSTNPDMRIIIQRDKEQVEITPDIVIAHSHLCKGVISFLVGNLKDSQICFEQSLKFYPTADAQLRLAYCIAAQGDRDAAIAAFQRVIDNYPIEQEAVEAKKAILELVKIKPKKWEIALILSILFGIWGADRFYLGYIKAGLIKLITAGGLLIWWIIDIIKIALNKLPDANGYKLQKTNKQTAIQRR